MRDPDACYLVLHILLTLAFLDLACWKLLSFASAADVRIKCLHTAISQHNKILFSCFIQWQAQPAIVSDWKLKLFHNFILEVQFLISIVVPLEFTSDMHICYVVALKIMSFAFDFWCVWRCENT